MGTESKLGQERVDWKKVYLFLTKKIWFIVFCGVAGALIGSSLYLLITDVLKGPVPYQVEGGFYIDFADGVLDAHDYYNAYTWNSVIHQDKIMESVVTQLKEKNAKTTDREYVENTLSADILSDVRYLSVTVVCEDEVLATQIFDACEVALEEFGKDMKEFDSITVTNQSEAKKEYIPHLTWRAAFAGTMTGLVLGVLIFFFCYACDDAVYTCREGEEKFGIPFWGVIIRRKNVQNPKEEKWTELCMQEMQKNLLYHFAGKEICFLPVQDVYDQTEQMAMSLLGEEIKITNITEQLNQIDFLKIRKTEGVLLGIPYGKRNRTIVRKYMEMLKKQDCNIVGAIITKADGAFLEKYYRTGKIKFM